MLHLHDFPVPIHESLGNNNRVLPNLRDELPSYGVAGPSNLRRHISRERQLHEFSLEDSDRRMWAAVQLYSWAPSAKSLPVFLEEQDVSGHVVLDLRQPESIKRVEVSIMGFVRALHRETNFFRVSETLWDSSSGDPRSPNQHNGMKFKGKLEGSYSWPFSIVLPREITPGAKLLRELRLNRSELLPPSLDNLGLNSVINYRLIVSIKKRGLLKPDSIISTRIGYTPITRPGPFSSARRRAYMEKTFIPGPSIDPRGWRVLRDTRVDGTLFKQREISATYTDVMKLALATPLAYTRGTVIPCHLTIRSSDKQALDLLSTPSAPRITFRRKLITRMVLTPAERADLATFPDDQPLSRAIWAPIERSANEVTLTGELSVPVSCVPTFNFGEFRLEYFVDICPPDPAGFQPSTGDILSSTYVQIVSAYAESGPRPRAYITPAHDASQRVAEADTRGHHLAALALEGSSSPALEAVRSGSATQPEASSSIGPVSSHQMGMFEQSQMAQNVISSESSSSPAGTRRLNRRFSAI
ncbi:hypothetical protein ACEPAF_6727 [Sanghuangporus sanghuang]